MGNKLESSRRRQSFGFDCSIPTATIAQPMVHSTGIEKRRGHGVNKTVQNVAMKLREEPLQMDIIVKTAPGYKVVGSVCLSYLC